MLAVQIFHFQDGGDVPNFAGLPRVSCSEVQKGFNALVPGQKLGTKVSKSRGIPPYVPGVSSPPPGWPLISA